MNEYLKIYNNKNYSWRNSKTEHISITNNDIESIVENLTQGNTFLRPFYW